MYNQHASKHAKQFKQAEQMSNWSFHNILIVPTEPNNLSKSSWGCVRNKLWKYFIKPKNQSINQSMNLFWAPIIKFSPHGLGFMFIITANDNRHCHCSVRCYYSAHKTSHSRLHGTKNYPSLFNRFQALRTDDTHHNSYVTVYPPYQIPWVQSNPFMRVFPTSKSTQSICWYKNI